MSEQNKPKWLVEWEDELHRDNRNAVRAHYWRKVKEGAFPDSDEAWRAFVHGWCGTTTYQTARRRLQHAGEGAYSFMAVFWLIGGLLIVLPIFPLIFAPARVDTPQTLVALIAVGVGLLLLGEQQRRRWHRAGNEAREDFNEEWGPKEDRHVEE